MNYETEVKSKAGRKYMNSREFQSLPTNEKFTIGLEYPAFPTRLLLPPHVSSPTPEVDWFRRSWLLILVSGRTASLQ
ncbi:hypothetical protein E2C01_040942 [Portunus trituberculatus]|uniref:Uncharacterized protein n=1 Tax=Portunus trituberculatus TaxID=210409 RepID=A0A5B7FS55_PORTR|nr:hypothetical protein [Portunus trituberculatus]